MVPQGNVGTFVLYFLFKFVLFIGAAILAVIVTCLTCCIAVIPYLGTVILLPIFVFFRCYSLYFMQQFGPPWIFFDLGYTCPVCGYDLRGSLEQAQCPECGTPIIDDPLGDAPLI